MNRSELIERLAQSSNLLSPEESETVVKCLIDALANALCNGERIEIRGFGSFETKRREARMARNPKTGETVETPAKRIPHFKPGKLLRERVNKR
jgi:integration host factor subunit beta